MGLVMSHTYNLSHAYLSHTHTVKHPTSVALLIEQSVWHIETDLVGRDEIISTILRVLKEIVNPVK